MGVAGGGGREGAQKCEMIHQKEHNMKDMESKRFDSFDFRVFEVTATTKKAH